MPTQMKTSFVCQSPPNEKFKGPSLFWKEFLNGAISKKLLHFGWHQKNFLWVPQKTVGRPIRKGDKKMVLEKPKFDKKLFGFSHLFCLLFELLLQWKVRVKMKLYLLSTFHPVFCVFFLFIRFPSHSLYMLYMQTNLHP